MRGGVHTRLSLLLHPPGEDLGSPFSLWMQVLQVTVLSMICGQILEETARNGANQVECRVQDAGRLQ